MRVQATRPTGKVQPFAANETFFSTTDRRGVITAGNTVFARTSGYSLEELVGQPHNLIRHPDMPRLVFQRLWAAVKAGRPFLGYVKNQAKNGNHYWVFALVIPLADEILSVRIKPTSSLLESVELLYRELLSAETDALSRGASESQACAASAQLLPSLLAGLHFEDYDSFAHHALNREIKSRDAELTRTGLVLFHRHLRVIGRDSGPLARFHAQALTAYDRLCGLFGSLDALVELHRTIRERQRAIQSIAEDLRLGALNAHIAAHPLGDSGVTVATLANALNGHGRVVTRNLETLAQAIGVTTESAAAIAAAISSSRVLIEVLLGFIAEIAASESSVAQGLRSPEVAGGLRSPEVAGGLRSPVVAEGLHSAEVGGGLRSPDSAPAGRAPLQVDLRSLCQHLCAALTHMLAESRRALETLGGHIPRVRASNEQLRQDIVYLQVVQISGLIEVARLPQADDLRASFTLLRDQVAQGKRELDALADIVSQLTGLAQSTPPQLAEVAASARTLELPALVA